MLNREFSFINLFSTEEISLLRQDKSDLLLDGLLCIK
jgi:hypothetical protein